MKHTITEEGNFEITDRGQEVLHLDGEDLDMFLYSLICLGVTSRNPLS